MSDVYEKIKKAWQFDVKFDYENGLINSERCLQASLYRALRLYFNEEKIFVEPQFYAEGTIPDIIICSNKRIQVVFEIKFMPDTYPSFEEDLLKLCRLSESESPEKNSVKELDPCTGKFSKKEDKKYSLCNETTKFIFAAIGQGYAIADSIDSLKVDGLNKKKIKSYFEEKNLESRLPERFILLYGKLPSSENQKKIEFIIEKNYDA
ncbi:MAG: hypothetical protein PHW04_03635 [Candidatus Wallbacteria bacterium]|nr:hypothetical protein [Candidatus Wallbacteria bacterium]